jgi:hypothetical protein
MTTALVALLLGAGIGLSLGMLGGGGSILTVPALVYVLGQDSHAAVDSRHPVEYNNIARAGTGCQYVWRCHYKLARAGGTRAGTTD